MGETVGSGPVEVRLLGDHPELIPAVGVLRYQEWGHDVDDRQSWIAVTAAEAGRDRLPITLVAVGPEEDVVGAVALGEVDAGLSDRERGNRSPWLLGLVVRARDRRRGVGRLLVAALERLAVGQGFGEVWVATGGGAVAFYRRCGWRDVTQFRLGATGIPTTILTQDLTA